MDDLSSLPRKRVGAGVVLRDELGRVLLVEPTYKDDWEIPGGLVEPGESPTEAARRECREELGTDVEVGDLLCVHYTHGSDPPEDGVMFVFDAGSTARPAEDFTLPPEELRSARFVAIADLAGHVVPAMVRRLEAADAASGSGQVAYLER